MDELRIKNNSDLHKLWYVLLKERNMLLTMQHEYERQCELFPNPERIEKVSCECGCVSTVSVRFSGNCRCQCQIQWQLSVSDSMAPGMKLFE